MKLYMKSIWALCVVVGMGSHAWGGGSFVSEVVTNDLGETVTLFKNEHNRILFASTNKVEQDSVMPEGGLIEEVPAETTDIVVTDNVDGLLDTDAEEKMKDASVLESTNTLVSTEEEGRLKTLAEGTEGKLKVSGATAGKRIKQRRR